VSNKIAAVGPQRVGNAWDNFRKTTITVLWTKDWDLFIMLPAASGAHDSGPNRQVNVAHVTKIANEIADKGYRQENPIHVIPITVSGVVKLGVVAGQHRFQACKSKNVEIGFLILNKTKDEAMYDVMFDHALTKPWQTGNYISAYAQIDGGSYNEVEVFAKQYDLDSTLALKILSSESHVKGDAHRLVNQATATATKSGTLVLRKDQIANGHVTMAKVNKIRYHSPLYGRFVNHKPFVKACVDFVTHVNYDEKRMVKQLGEQAGCIVKSVKEDDYFKLLSAVFNRHLKATGKIER